MPDLSSALHLAASELTLAVGALVLLMVGAFIGDKSARLVSILSVLLLIAAAVVGGASLSGGRGSALGVVLGALIIQMINSGIVILGIDQNYSQIIIGSVVIAAVVLDNVNSWLARRRLQKASES
jgi:ABC-type xylose transport system permease subunit